MEATYRITLEELTPEFISALKTTFHDEARDIEISLHIQSKSVSAELLRRMENIERGENPVRFEGDEFKEFVEKLPRLPIFPVETAGFWEAQRLTASISGSLADDIADDREER